MATMPQAAAPMDPSASPDAADGAQDNPGGYCIEIHIGAKGDIKVSVEPEAEESAEESGSADGAAPGESEDAQAVPSIREAIKLVMEIYQSQGEMPDASQDQADMSAGYGKD